jgi:hypothetical protein
MNPLLSSQLLVLLIGWSFLAITCLSGCTDQDNSAATIVTDSKLTNDQRIAEVEGRFHVGTDEHPYKAVVEGLKGESLRAKLSYYAPKLASLDVAEKWADSRKSAEALIDDLILSGEIELIQHLEAGASVHHRMVIWKRVNRTAVKEPRWIANLRTWYSAQTAPVAWGRLCMFSALPEAWEPLTTIALDTTNDPVERYYCALAISSSAPDAFRKRLEPLLSERQLFYPESSPPGGRIFGDAVRAAFDRSRRKG